MARPRANFPVVTWPVTLTAPLHVQVERVGFTREYTIDPGDYQVFDPSEDSPTGTYGLAYSGADFIANVDNGSLPARLGSILKEFWMDLHLYADNALIDVAYDAYTPEQWVAMGAGTGLSPSTTGVWAAPAAAAYVIEPESDSGPDDIIIRFSSDPAYFFSPNPDTDNVDDDIMGPGAMGAGFWGLFGFGQTAGSLRTRSFRLRYDSTLARYTSVPGVGVPQGGLLPPFQGPVPFRGTWCPDQDVVDDDREAIASVGVAANPYSVQSGRVALYGPQRYRVATVFPYVVCNRVDRHRLADESFDRLVEMERGLASPTFIREMLVTWDDVHRAALDNKPLTLIWQPRHPAPAGLRGRLRGRILDSSSLSSWGSTSSDSTDNGQYRQVVLVMEVEDV